MLIPASVRAYVHDGGIRRAVRELVSLPSNDLLDGLAWSELSRFYRARLAARQLECDWGVFAIDVWNSVWGGLLDGWTAFTPDEQMSNEADVGVDLDSLLRTPDDSLWFGRMFSRGGATFYAAIAAVPMEGLKAKISCDRAGPSVSFAALGAVTNEDDNWTVDLTLPLDGDKIDPGPLREKAAAAVRIADAMTTPRGRRRS